MQTAPENSSLDCDLLVIGSGAGGLSAAVVAAKAGLKVIVVEKEAQFGGTTAWSGGWMWLPHNALAREAGIIEDLEKPWGYLRHELGEQFDEVRVKAFLQAAPEMLDFFRSQTALQFIDGNAIPDFHGNSPNAGTGGRSVCAANFDALKLGAHFKNLKPPLYETTLWGLGVAAGAEMRHFFNALSNWASFRYVVRLVLRHWKDCLLHGRSSRLVGGNALVAALATSFFDAGGQMLLESPARELIEQNGNVSGAILTTLHGEIKVHTSCAVLLACGGFPHDSLLKSELLAQCGSEKNHYSAGARGNTGDGLRLAQKQGAHIQRDLHQAAALAPVSLVPRHQKLNDGGAPNGFAHFPHLIERAKPGLIAVTAHGKRFTNEANSYHDFLQDLLKLTPENQAPKAWLICDHRFIRRYGLGAVKPFPFPLAKWLKNGYVKHARSIAELAKICAIPTEVFQSTITRYNAQCKSGIDTDFHKGQTAYNRIQGDEAFAKKLGFSNPCMATLEVAPFYAVQIHAGSLGTFAGLQVDENSRVLDANRQPIAGLYANGNDASSVMGGHYPAGGITLGPAMTFGYIAAQHILKRTLKCH